MILKF